MPIMNDLALAQRVLSETPLGEQWWPVPATVWAPLFPRHRIRKGDHFKWCGCRHFVDLCTHSWQDDPEVFRW